MAHIMDYNRIIEMLDSNNYNDVRLGYDLFLQFKTETLQLINKPQYKNFKHKISNTAHQWMYEYNWSYLRSETRQKLNNKVLNSIDGILYKIYDTTRNI